MPDPVEPVVLAVETVPTTPASSAIPDTSGKIVDDGSAPAASEGSASEIPAWIPEKFHSAEDPVKAMADSYAELEKNQGKPAVEPNADLEKIPSGKSAEPAADNSKVVTFDELS